MSYELISLYWQIGHDLVRAQENHNWGEGRIASDLKTAFPGIEGFSRRNLYRMRQFYLAYSKNSEFVPQLVAQIPWGHNVVLLEKVKNLDERFWYVQQTLEHGWSRPILELQIQGKLYQRQGKALTNFAATLPPPQSDLAQQILKDPYHFDFLTLGKDAHEQSLERGLLEHLTKFLLELGVGFALVGSQYPLELDETYYIDLLFYHLKLRAFVVIELKAREVQPADVAQVLGYIGAVNELLRHPNDAPTIGLILGKGKKKTMVEYVLQNVKAPIGIADYITSEALPEELEADLPTVEQLEAELAKLDN